MQFALIFAVAIAAPQFTYSAPTEGSSEEVVPILKDARYHDEHGNFVVEVEAGNGIVMTRSYTPDDGVVGQAGQFSYTAPDGSPVVVKFVANEFGYQPESDRLPVAPAPLHPIPQFVLDQIAFAAAEDAARADDSYES